MPLKVMTIFGTRPEASEDGPPGEGAGKPA